MAPTHYDCILIGAGHNGLVAAAYLAKARKKVLVLERRSLIGGSVVTEDFGEGLQTDAVWPGGSLRPDIIKDLNLAAFGLPPAAPSGPFISLLPDSAPLVLDPDPVKAAESIKPFSVKDAARWPEFVIFMDRAARLLDSAYSTIMPPLPKGFSLAEGYGLAELALDLRLAGREDMLRFIRMLPMTAQEFLEEWFESEPLKAALASLGIYAQTLGPLSAGTGFTLLHNWLNRGGLSHANVGRAGQITQALARAIASSGGEILIGAEVKRVLIKDMCVTGVALASGQEYSASLVLSSADPKHTFLSLVGPMQLPPEFVWKTQSIKMRGSVAKLHILLDGPFDPSPATFVLAPSIPYIEHAYDAAKYGSISEAPYLEGTSVGNVLNVHIQYAPYALKTGDWDDQGPALQNRVLDALSAHFPNLKSKISNLKFLSPLDLEQTYGLTQGDLNHGQLMLDQFLFMRPIPGWSNHRTPIDGLYLCGSGVHAGGGVSGASGRNAARVVLEQAPAFLKSKV